MRASSYTLARLLGFWAGEVMRRVVSCFYTAVLAIGVTVPAPVMAEGLVLLGNKTSRQAMFRTQTRVLDTRAAKQYSASVRLQPNAPEAKAESVPQFRGSYKGEYLEVAKAAARKHAVPEDLFLRLVQQESGWNPSATSHAGAQGLAQLMPGTAVLVGVDINDPHQNLDGGARYLRMMYDKFGSWRLALAAYNAGPSAVEKHSGIPPFQETKDYVRIILGS
jgi:soluble lytic murein transglycosylase-like protein